METTEQLQARFLDTPECQNFPAFRTTESEFEHEHLPSAMGGRVDGLISALETCNFSSEVLNHQSGRKDKWLAFHEDESDKEFNRDEDGMMNKSFLQCLLSDYDQHLSSNPSAQKLKSLQAKLGIYDEEDGPHNLPALLMQIPDLNEALQCLEYYHQSCEWIHRLLHWPSFRFKVFQMLSQKHRISTFSRIDIHWFGLLFAVCGLGLWTGGSINGEHHQEDALPIRKQGKKLALSWLRCATSALVIGQYDQTPSLDSLRTMSLLICFPLYLSDKPSMEGTMDLTTQTISLARQLNLHIDPDDLPCCKISTDVAKDERRRFMVAILCQEFQLGGLFCKKGYLEPPSGFMLKMPSKLYDEADEPNSLLPSINTGDRICRKSQQGKTANMNGVISRYKVGQIWQLIGICFCENQGPPGHQLVLELDQQLTNVEHEFPPDLKTSFDTEHYSIHPPPQSEATLDMDRLSTYVLLASAHIRLHRPFVIPRAGISKMYHDWHRRRVLYYGRLLLTVREHNHLPLLKHVSINLSILAAGIALAVLLITTGKEENVTSLRRQVHQVYRTYQDISHNNTSIWNRGYQLLGILLETDKARLLNPQLKINTVNLEKLLH